MTDGEKEARFEGIEGEVGELITDPKPWGELRRGNHPEFGSIIYVLYTSDEGRKALLDSLPYLKRWSELAKTATPGLTKVLRIVEDNEVPYLIVSDPGGDVIANKFASEPTGLKKRGGMLASVSVTLSLAKTYDLPHLGLTPEGIIEAPSDHDAPWHILPILPGARHHGKLLYDGTYAAPELSHDDHPIEELSPNVHALSLIGIDVLRGEFGGNRDTSKLEESVPFPRILSILKNGLRPVKGKYDDPKMLQLALQKWLKKEAEDDWKENQERLASMERSQWQQKLYENKGVLIKSAIGAGALLMVIFLVMLIPKIFTTTNTVNTPYGTINLWSEALINRDPAQAQTFTKDAASMQTEAILREIEAMEEANLASRLAEVVPRLAGAGSTRTAKLDIKGENGDLFMAAELVIKEEEGGTWVIEELYFDSLRDDESTSDQ